MPGNGDTASAWVRSTDRLNALVWELPIPRRLKVWLSQIIFHNPPMHRTRVLEILGALEGAGLSAVLVGGWGVDALMGRQLRKHSDLDLLVEPHKLDRAVGLLGEIGFEPWNEDDAPAALGPVRLERTASCRDRALRVVDLHEAVFATLEVAEGLVGTRTVVCISAEQQLASQTGRVWTPGRAWRRYSNASALRRLLASKAG